jgi:GTP-binding protein
LADLPGLIEDAHAGKGLGHRFLGHAERCHTLIHLLDASVDDPEKNYHIIRKELTSYHPDFRDKKEIIVLNKADLLTPEDQARLKTRFQALSPLPVFVISAAGHLGLKDLIRYIDTVMSAA